MTYSNPATKFGNKAVNRLNESIYNFDDDFQDYILGEHIEYFDFDTYNELTHEIYLMLPKEKRDELEKMYVDDLFSCVVSELEDEYEQEEESYIELENEFKHEYS